MLFVALGDATDIRTRGGAPYYLWTTGKQARFIDRAGRLDLSSLKGRRLVWNATRMLRYREKGGFQFSSACSSFLFRHAELESPTDEILSQFPMFPPDSWFGRTRVNYYIDATLKQNFDAYGLAQVVGPRMQAEALKREGERYRAAERLVCMNRWAARSMVADYGVPAEKIHIVVGGANLDESKLDEVRARGVPPMRPVKLGFVGGEWRRKNLPLLLRVAEVLVAQGIETEVWAAGFAKESGPSHPLLRSVGYLDKRQSMDKFVSFLQGMHFGCLFSEAEASPRFTLECLRLGIPVLTWDVGGIADTVPAELGRVFPAESTAETIAATVAEYARDADAYAALRERVWERSDEFSWVRAIEQFQAIWSGSQAYRYMPAAGCTPDV